MILALDTATTTGWAAGKPGDTPKCGARRFGGGSTGEVIGLFRYWLNGRCDEFDPTLIVFEKPYIPRGGRKGPMIPEATIRRLLGIAAQVEAVAWERKIACREASPLEIARFFIGTQTLKRAEKKAATIAMCGRYGWLTESDDVADALALWAMAEATIAPKLAARRGEGPLFIPQTASAPRSARTRGALKPLDEKDSSLWPAQLI